MSYILDALRKSEKQRQAIQPDTVTERLLVDSPDAPVTQKSAKWIMALVLSNLLIIGYFAWLFSHKKPLQPLSNKVVTHQEKISPQPVAEMPKVKVDPTTDNNANSQGGAEDSLGLQQYQRKHAPPSIAQLYEEKKEILRRAQAQKAAKNANDAKKTVAQKKEVLPENPIDSESDPYHRENLPVQPEAGKTKNAIPELADLPYQTRSQLPKLAINVFSYAHQPEDSFVIIDMVKYKAGQVISGSLKLKEIRPNSVLLENGSDIFSIARP